MKRECCPRMKPVVLFIFHLVLNVLLCVALFGVKFQSLEHIVAVAQLKESEQQIDDLIDRCETIVYFSMDKSSLSVHFRHFGKDLYLLDFKGAERIFLSP